MTASLAVSLVLLFLALGALEVWLVGLYIQRGYRK